MALSPRHTKLEIVLTAILTLCAAVTTMLVLRREFALGRPPGGALEPQFRSDWKTFLANGKSLGVPTGRIKIVEFVDFQCPYCAVFANSLDSLMRLYPSEVYVVVRSFPLSMHPHAATAARAAECAAQQRAFERYYHRVFTQPDSIWFSRTSELALILGIPDTSEFSSCIASHWAETSVATDSTEGARLGLQGTPLVMLNGWMFPGTPSTADLVRVIERQQFLP